MDANRQSFWREKRVLRDVSKLYSTHASANSLTQDIVKAPGGTE